MSFATIEAGKVQKEGREGTLPAEMEGYHFQDADIVGVKDPRENFLERVRPPRVQNLKGAKIGNLLLNLQSQYITEIIVHDWGVNMFTSSN